MKKGVLIVAIFVLFGVSASAQEDKPLGDVARAERAGKSSAPKSAKVTTNDEIPSSPEISGGTLSAPKQAFCDELA